MKIYGVYKNIDTTEGRGPMLLVTLWFDEDKAIKEIQKNSGVDVGKAIGSKMYYGGFLVYEEFVYRGRDSDRFKWQLWKGLDDGEEHRVRRRVSKSVQRDAEGGDQHGIASGGEGVGV